MTSFVVDPISSFRTLFNSFIEHWKQNSFIAVFLLSSFVATSFAAPLSSKPVGVKARLVSEAKTIVPGQTITVALSLKHEEGFHTYWMNPGIVGVATMLNWTLPEGFAAGEIQWQVPEHVQMIGLYNAHGYNSDALLLIDITAPDKLPEGPITLKAGGAWMSCAKKQCCNLGYQEFSLSLNTGKKVEWNDETKAQIEEARRKLPKTINGWNYSASRSGDKITLTVKNKAGVPVSIAKDVYFYSENNHIDTLIDQVVSVKGDELTIVLQINDSFKEKEIAGVGGLFYHPGGWPGAEGRKYMPVSVAFESTDQQKK